VNAPATTPPGASTASSAPPGSSPPPASAAVTVLTPADEHRRRRLVRMKLTAAGLLAAMAVIFVLARLGEPAHPGLGYLRAAAEAGMVGALADWFAVTALFRRPLGLPIPHTAIIPARKDAIGSSLSEFVATNFLSEPVVREKLAGFSVAGRLGGFLTGPGVAERIVAEGASLVRGAAAVLSDEQVAQLLEGLARGRIDRFQLGPAVGRIAADVFARGDHHPLVDVLVDRAAAWVHDNPSAVAGLVAERAPTWSPRFLDERVAGRIYRELDRFLQTVRDDPDHAVRGALDRLLARLAQDLQHDPATMARADALKQRLLNNAQVRSLAASAWSSVKAALLDAAADPDSTLRRSAVEGVRALGARLQTDRTLGAKVDGWAADAAGYLARHHARSVTGIIDETIARWDGPATSRKIELAIGRDLQFIRINGTVVGALAGLAIYSLAQLLPG